VHIAHQEALLAGLRLRNQPTGIAESLEACLNAYARMRSEGEVVIPLYDPALLERFPDGRIG